MIVPAAGLGSRMGGQRKQLRQLGGATVLLRTLQVFDRHPTITSLVVATREEDRMAVSAEIVSAGLSKEVLLVVGGDSRQASVFRALENVSKADDVVLVHDAVRPFVTGALISAVIERAWKSGAAAAAVPVVDTLRMASGVLLSKTVSRDDLFRMQTPQGFRRDVLVKAHEAAASCGAVGTDDVELVRRIGQDVVLVPGEAANFKVTTEDDWELARALWAWRAD